MDRLICVITGATSGIGKAAALALAKQGYGLILVGRNQEKTARVGDEISRKTGNRNVVCETSDLSVLREVRQLAARIRTSRVEVDVLVNNAGARFLKHQVTGEGIELTLATNHLGHFLLTLSLIDVLKHNGRARIINVSSGTHYGASGVIENILSPEAFDGRTQYANSKLANVLFTYALAEKLSKTGVTVNAVDPGGVATNFARNNGLIQWLKHRAYYLGKRQLLTPAQGAETLVYLASSADVAGITGKYFMFKEQRKSSAISYEKTIQDKLWASSVELSMFDI